MFRGIAIASILLVLTAAAAQAQLPADAVMLDKVKIVETQKSTDLCPVTLGPSDKSIPTWTYKGVEYRGAKPECQAQFDKDPDKYAEAAKAKRWQNNFIHQMSIIWCPVTDEVNSGGGLKWTDKTDLKLTFESCCEFCNEDVTEEDFPAALELLVERAKESYELSGGKYAINPRSPVQGAIKIPGITEYLGNWKLEVNAPNGNTFEITLAIKQEAGDLAGMMTSRRGESAMEDIDADEEGNISFQVTRERDGQEFIIQYSGVVDGEKITGTAKIDAGGQTFEMDFEGARQPDEPAEEKKGEA